MINQIFIGLGLMPIPEFTVRFGRLNRVLKIAGDAIFRPPLDALTRQLDKRSR